LEVINTILGIPLGYILYFCYQLLGNFGLAILLFTVLTKVILFPLSVVSQKNAIIMVRIQPELDDIKRYHSGNSSLILEEQKKLYKRERYSTIKGMLPLLIQIPLILGLINVIYNPLQHLLHMDPVTIQTLVHQASTLINIPVEELGFAAQLKVMELVQADPGGFASLATVGDAVAQIRAVNMEFLGANMAYNPTFNMPSVLYPLLSGLSALALSLYQNKYYILQKTASRLSKWGMTIFLVAFSTYFAAVLPCGLGLYWTVGNLLSILVVWLCNLIYNPKKLVDASLLVAKPPLSAAQKAAERERKRSLRSRERADIRRFVQQPDKQLVFYAENGGFFKYYEPVISWLLEHSDLTLHYVTNDPDDSIFNQNEPRNKLQGEVQHMPRSRPHGEAQGGLGDKSQGESRLKSYYVGPKAIIPFMMKLDATMVIMTTPDLETYHIKRSLVRKDAEYVYLDHGMSSFHMVFREGALDHFDTILCYGPNHIKETRQLEDAYGLPEKRLVKAGFGLFDRMVQRVQHELVEANDPPVVMIAPSWQMDNILESCFEQTVEPLLTQGYEVIVRPHPEFVKRFPQKMRALQERAEKLRERVGHKAGEKRQESDTAAPVPSDAASVTPPASVTLPMPITNPAGCLRLDVDFSDNRTVYHADILITDWSTVALEFSFSTFKPTIFINTPMKVINPNWQRIEAIPIELSLRDKLGVALDIKELDRIGAVVAALLASPEDYSKRIELAYEQTMFNRGWADQAAGEYILSSLALAAQRRERSLSPGTLQESDYAQ
jgi:YidC/Oxa1 family membrane protein insertase